MPEQGLASEGRGLLLDQLSKVFERRGKSPVHAVAGISLAVAEGEFLGLLGPSGCGKSTTLRMIAGLELPTSGTILLDGEDVTFERAGRRDIAFVFQLFALYPHMNTRNNTAFPLKCSGLSRS